MISQLRQSVLLMIRSAVSSRPSNLLSNLYEACREHMMLLSSDNDCNVFVSWLWYKDNFFAFVIASMHCTGGLFFLPQQTVWNQICVVLTHTAPQALRITIPSFQLTSFFHKPKRTFCHCIVSPPNLKWRPLTAV